MENNKPFTMQWTLDRTLERMEQCINLSLEKTVKRLPEFATDPKKSAEIIQTIVHLINLKDNIKNDR